MKVYLTQSTKSGSKFWQIETKGKKYITTFGKVGCKGRTTEKSFGSKSECEQKAKVLLNQKTKKGYSKSKKRKKYESSESESESESESSSISSSMSSSDSPPPKKKRKKLTKKKTKKIFKEYKFVISGGLTSKTKKEFEKLINEFGGLCTSTTNKETDFVIVKKINPILSTAKCKQGIKLKIPIVSEEFVIESIEKNKLLKYTPYIIDEEEEEEESEESEEEEEEDDDESDNDKNKKSYKKVKMSGSAPVDEYFDHQSWTVFEENGIVWDAMLNQTNIGQNNNKFYKLQILTDSDENEFCAFFRWARVGYKGQMSRNWGNKNQCIAKFKQKFFDKTLNDWEDRDDFQSHAKKYTYLPMDYGGDDDDNNNNNDDDEEKNNSIESKLHSDVQDLVELIFDKKMMEKQMKEIGYDAAKLPLGKVDKTIITEAYEILKDIEDEINNKLKSKKKGRSTKRSSSSSSSSTQKVNSSEITELSSRYYTLIPHEFGFRVPPPINSEKALNKEMKLIEALSEIEVASRLLAKDKKNKKNKIEKHPIDKHFDLLKCSMESISTSCDEFKMLANYVKLTHASTHNRYSLSVERIFKLDRDGSDDRFQSFSKIPNRQLLWHGSRLTNFVGIISQGLRIAPPEAPVTGYMFGKGVYFADMCSKSANYCFTSPTSNTGLILLCEVALGDMNKLTHSDYYASNLPQGKLSTKGCGRTSPDPSTHIIMDNGCIIPSGKSIKDNNMQTSLLYNEYIVYDTKQIKMRYLLKLKFNYHNAGW